MKNKRLQEQERKNIRSLLLEGKTSKQVAEIMAVSVATINNLRALFKKDGDNFTKKKLTSQASISTKPKLKLTSKNQIATKLKKNIINKDAPQNSEYVYNINGTSISFIDKPKSIQIGKNKIIVNYN